MLRTVPFTTFTFQILSLGNQRLWHQSREYQHPCSLWLAAACDLAGGGADWGAEGREAAARGPGEGPGEGPVETHVSDLPLGLKGSSAPLPAGNPTLKAFPQPLSSHYLEP